MRSSIFLLNVLRNSAGSAAAIVMLGPVLVCPRCVAVRHTIVPLFVAEAEASMSLTISSPSFANGGNIAQKFTCDGADLSP